MGNLSNAMMGVGYSPYIHIFLATTTSSQIKEFESKLTQLGFANHSIHYVGW